MGIHPTGKEPGGTYGPAGPGAISPPMIECWVRSYELNWELDDRDCCPEDVIEDGYEQFERYAKDEISRRGEFSAEEVYVELYPDGQTRASMTFTFVEEDEWIS
jgi:hypothetical protein